MNPDEYWWDDGAALNRYSRYRDRWYARKHREDEPLPEAEDDLPF